MHTSKGLAAVPLIILIVLLAGVAYYFFSRPPAVVDVPDDDIVFCTQDAKLCPDGSYVGRTGPNCEFSACPNTPTNGAATDGNEGISVGEPYSYEGEILAGSMAMSPLIDFNKNDYERALQTDKLIVLYFYANWCPLCKAEVETALYPAFNELATDDIVGFRINYKDNATDKDEEALAKEFNITYQHTKVFVRDGVRVLKAPDSWDKTRYLSEFSNY